MFMFLCVSHHTRILTSFLTQHYKSVMNCKQFLFPSDLTTFVVVYLSGMYIISIHQNLNFAVRSSTVLNTKEQAKKKKKKKKADLRLKIFLYCES